MNLTDIEPNLLFHHYIDGWFTHLWQIFILEWPFSKAIHKEAQFCSWNHSYSIASASEKAKTPSLYFIWTVPISAFLWRSQNQTYRQFPDSSVDHSQLSLSRMYTWSQDILWGYRIDLVLLWFVVTILKHRPFYNNWNWTNERTAHIWQANQSSPQPRGLCGKSSQFSPVRLWRPSIYKDDLRASQWERNSQIEDPQTGNLRFFTVHN